jgi:hypothetical protein
MIRPVVKEVYKQKLGVSVARSVKGNAAVIEK